MAAMPQRSSVCVPVLAAAALGSQLIVGSQLFVSSNLRASPALQQTGTLPTSQIRAGAPATGNFIPGASVMGTITACSLVAVARRQQGKTGRAAFDPSSMPGVTDPLGFFDPLGFATGKDEANFRRLRVAETKHGRVAMMASIGTVFTHSLKFPGFENVPAGLGALSSEDARTGLIAIVVLSGLLELVLFKDDANKEPGNFGDPLSWSKIAKVERVYELNNGRMAMLAIFGQLAAELATGQDAAEQMQILHPPTWAP